MKIWIVILIVAAIGLIVFLMRQRERFSSGAIEPTCPGETILVGVKCRLDGVDRGEDGQCPPGTSMNEEGMCQAQFDPICGPEYTLTIEDGVAKCEPNVRPVELTDEENLARGNAMTEPQCPAGYIRDQTTGLDNLRCMRDTGTAPVCPAGSTFDRDAYAWSIAETTTGTGVCFSANGPVPAQCPDGTFPDFIYFENTPGKFTCVEYRSGAVPSTPAPPAPPPAPIAPPPPPPIAPPPPLPVLLPETPSVPPTPRELVFQPKLLGTPGGGVVPADTRIGELIGGLFSPAEPRPEPRPSEYTL